MISPTDLVVQSGPDLDIQWTITDDECIVIRVKRPQGPAGGIQRLAAPKDSSWSSSESCGDSFNKITFSSRSDVSRPPSNTAGDRLPSTQRRIARKWEKLRLKTHEQPWPKQAQEFFGTSTYESAEQFSYVSLENGRTKAYRQQIPFHKVHLSRTFQRCLQQTRLGIPTIRDEDCRKRLVAEYHPGYHSLDAQERNTICRRFRGYLDEGRAYDLISKGNEGFLLFADWTCSADDLKVIEGAIQKGSSLAETIGKDMADYSKKHGGDARRLLDYLLLEYLQRGEKRHCDGGEPSPKRQQPTRHKLAHDHENPQIHLTESTGAAAALLDAPPNYLIRPSDMEAALPSNVLRNLDPDLDTWTTLIDLDPLLNSWRPDGEAHTIANEGGLLSGTEYGMV